MSAWQSFIVAWVAAQLIPVVLEEPNFLVLLGAAELIAAFVAFFSGLNLIQAWLHEVLARPPASAPVARAGATGSSAQVGIYGTDAPLGSWLSSSPTVTRR